jgi:transposase, IS5 family
LRVAHAAGAIETKDLELVVVDTTVQPKAIAHPTDTRLMLRAIEQLAAAAKDDGVELRQSYVRVAKRAAIMAGRYAHAHQFRRHRRKMKFLRTRLGRVIRDVSRKIEGRPALEAAFAEILSLSRRVLWQDHHQRGQKVYALHAPEVECIGKGKARAPYEFGCKVSVVTPVTSPSGGQFVLHAEAHHGNPFDGHTLTSVLDHLQQTTGIEAKRVHVDRGYRGHGHTNPFRIWITGQVRNVTRIIKREMKRRAAIEPMIGHRKAEHRLGRNYLKGRAGDRINAILAAAGYNFHLLLRWFSDFLRLLLLHAAALDTRIPSGPVSPAVYCQHGKHQQAVHTCTEA